MYITPTTHNAKQVKCQFSIEISLSLPFSHIQTPPSMIEESIIFFPLKTALFCGLLNCHMYENIPLSVFNYICSSISN